MANSLIIEGIPTGNVYVGDRFDLVVRDKSATTPGFDSVSVVWIYDSSKVYIWEEFINHTYTYHVLLLDAGSVVLTARRYNNSESVSATVNIYEAITVTLDANGGSVSDSTLTVVNRSVTLPTPTHDSNHIFMGWFTESTFGYKIGNAGDTINNINMGFTAHAQWLYLNYFPLTNNQRYIDAQESGESMNPAGIMVHSTGANNAKLSRYVWKDKKTKYDALLGEKTSTLHWNVYHPFCSDGDDEAITHHKDGFGNGTTCAVCGGKCACVHAFIGKLADGTVAVYQTLPWNYKGWHSGKGKNGSANDSRFIGFEICEDGYNEKKEEHEEYVKEVFYEAVKLCAYLCKRFDNIKPVKASSNGIISHKEGGHELEIASKHYDPDHWFVQYGYTMDYFRECVKKVIGEK